MSNFKIIAHRGASAYELENSYKAFVKAIEMEADMIETDVRQTEDGKLILMHDKTINRTTEGKGKINKMTLKTIKKTKMKNGDNIPILDNILDQYGNKIKFNLELKDGNIEQSLNELIMKYDIIDRVLISSFSFKILKSLHQINPDINLALLTYLPSLISKINHSFNKCSEYGIKNINPWHIFKSKSYVQKAHKLGFKIYPWTINKKKEAIKLRDELKVDGIITNFPDILK
ncbi:MAG: hypothetical protein GF329_09605 [Candidatus Lokiarchaeota archaeon]|nr:hypothetical protein [Candidatus Lokiarchaeota archaeon]